MKLSEVVVIWTKSSLKMKGKTIIIIIIIIIKVPAPPHFLLCRMSAGTYCFAPQVKCHRDMLYKPEMSATYNLDIKFDKTYPKFLVRRIS